MAADSKVIEYIAQCQKRGFTSHSIRNALYGQGHTKNDVDGAFASYLKVMHASEQGTLFEESTLSSKKAVVIIGAIIALIFLSAFLTNSYLLSRYPRTTGFAVAALSEDQVAEIQAIHNSLDQKEIQLILEVELLKLSIKANETIDPHIRAISRLQADIQKLRQKKMP
ncbi:MAG TPA: hypothetical protein VJB08_02755 [Candidatus Nanoarchaeia archaeon]|nr:hypothetical protein [Candidatus Nanoarchaeia archaeon]